MFEQDRVLPIENAITSLVIPTDAMPLSEMVEALIVEEEVLKATRPYLQEFFKSRVKPVKDHPGPEIVSLDKVSESEIEQVIARRSTSDPFDYFDRDTADSTMAVLLREAVRDAVECLPFKQRRTIESLFGLEDGSMRTPKEVGIMFRKTPQTIRNYEKSAFDKLKENRTLKEFYGERNKGAHKATEALINGVINAIHQKDFNRAQQNIKEIEYRKLHSEGLSFAERDVIEEIKQHPFSYRWSKETVGRFIVWSTSVWSNSQKRDFPIRVDVLAEAIAKLQEVWRLKAQIPANV